jgi:hypothetical protein
MKRRLRVAILRATAPSTTSTMMAGTIQPTDVGAPVLAVDVGGGEVVTVGGYVVASYISVPFSTCH